MLWQEVAFVGSDFQRARPKLPSWPVTWRESGSLKQALISFRLTRGLNGSKSFKILQTHPNPKVYDPKHDKHADPCFNSFRENALFVFASPLVICQDGREPGESEAFAELGSSNGWSAKGVDDCGAFRCLPNITTWDFDYFDLWSKTATCCHMSVFFWYE